MRRSIIYLCFLGLVAPAATGQIFKWRDENGRVHFGDRPTSAVKAEPVQLEPLNTMTPVDLPRAPVEPAPEAIQAVTTELPAMKRGKVVMYSTPTCGFCKQAKVYMKKKLISYVEKDITESVPARQEFQKYGGRGVPLILIGARNGTRKLHGFSVARFDAIYWGS